MGQLVADIRASCEKQNGVASSQSTGFDAGSAEAQDSADVLITAADEKRINRKIDLVVLPLMCTVFFCQYLDKQSLSYAAVFGLIQDLDLTSSQYSWCSSIFYVGQLVAEYPCIYLMSRLPLTKFVGVSVIVWGSICMCLAAPTNFAGFASVRFLLGFAEGAVSPAIISFTSLWYPKEKHAVRTAIWVSMNGIAQVTGCLLMYGVGKNQLALASWRVLFLICGGITIFGGIAFYFLMPGNVDQAWFLTQDERRILAARLARDKEGGDKRNFDRAQLLEALTDIKSWFTFAFGVLVTMQSPVLTFASLVIKNIGYDKYQIMLYGAPSGAVQVAMLWIGVLGCLIAPKHRSAVILCLIIPPLIGNILLLRLPISAGWGVIVSSWLASCITAIMSPLLSLSASNTKGNTKRAVVNTFFFIGYRAGCIASPQLWKKAPRYFEGVVTAIVTWCVLFVTVGAYWYVCRRENRRRDGAEQEGAVNDDGARRYTEKGELTDGQDVEFRYSY